MSYYSNLSGTLGMSGAAKWYFGQHAKIQDAIKKGDLKAAIEFATAGALGGDFLGIANKKYDEVINSPELLQKFKESCLAQYGEQGNKKNKEVADKVVALVDAKIASAVALTAPLPTLAPGDTSSFMMPTTPAVSTAGSTSGVGALMAVGAAGLALLAIVAVMRGRSKAKAAQLAATKRRKR